MIRSGVAAIVGLLLIASALWLGLRLRAAVWEWTMPIRYNGDINNGFRWGNFAQQVGYFNVYDVIGDPALPGGRGRRLDYAPLRLGLMSWWVGWLERNGRLTIDHGPQSRLSRWPQPDLVREPDRAFHAPLLAFNTVMEGLTATSAALLVWHVRRRAGGASPIATAGLAGAAALLVWFNPASLYEAHAWPQWDIWPMPFFLTALYCGMRRWWLAAGLLIGVASMLKGQILLVAWVLPLWAICLGQWRGALRLIAGALAAILLTGLPWVLTHYDPVTRLRDVNMPSVALGVLVTLAAALLPRRFSPGLICLALIATLYTSMYYLGGSDNWLQCAFGVGTYNHPGMFLGPTSNLPAILRTYYRWSSIHTPVFTAPALVWLDGTGAEAFRAGGLITIRTLLLLVYGAFCVVCGVRAATLDRRNDPRVIVALSLPWLFFFLIPCQMHERYLTYVAVCAATWVICGVGATLLGMVLMLVALIHLLMTVMYTNMVVPAGIERRGEDPIGFLRTLIEPTHPGIAWMLMLIALVLLYGLFAPRRRTEVSHAAA
ncbi:MAG TPA: glycosyltransferase family 87 protein [Tepidisphaeraceae bacterium]|jgi:hypothetical protein